MRTSPAPRIRTPSRPVPMPLKSRFRRITTSPLPALMTMPLVPETRTPARPDVPSIVIDFVIVSAPKPPGSSTSISPAGAVLEIAPAKVLHGAVRLQGLASSPTPETQVRVAWASTREGKQQTAAITDTAAAKHALLMTDSSRVCRDETGAVVRAVSRRHAGRSPVWTLLSAGCSRFFNDTAVSCTSRSLTESLTGYAVVAVPAPRSPERDRCAHTVWPAIRNEIIVSRLVSNVRLVVRPSGRPLRKRSQAARAQNIRV